MAIVFCFTSTGNSLYAAKKIAQQIDARVIPMNSVSLEKPAGYNDEVIGFVYPVFFWSLPRLVARFVSHIQIENKSAYIFAVATYGGAAFGANGLLNDLLKSRGAHLSYGVNLKCVDNYIPKYKPNDSEELRNKVDTNISEIAGSIKKRESNKIGSYTIVNKLIYRSLPDDRSDRYFTIAPSCTGCTTCRKVCPAANIEMKEGKPSFLGMCEHCLACLHNCPARAIDWKSKTQGKDRYRNFAITLDDMISFNSEKH
jgi:ferredoxin/flavodoxin